MKETKKIRFVAALGAVLILSSCNRGMGCPSDFSAADLFSVFLSILPF